MNRLGSYPSAFSLPIAAITEHGIIHVSDIAPLMRSQFDLEDEGDADAMEAVEHRVSTGPIADRPAPNRWSAE